MEYTISISGPGSQPVIYSVEAAGLSQAKRAARAIAAKHVHPASLAIRLPDYPALECRASSALAHFHWCAAGVPISADEIPNATLVDWGVAAATDVEVAK